MRNQISKPYFRKPRLCNLVLENLRKAKENKYVAPVNIHIHKMDTNGLY